MVRTQASINLLSNFYNNILSTRNLQKPIYLIIQWLVLSSKRNTWSLGLLEDYKDRVTLWRSSWTFIYDNLRTFKTTFVSILTSLILRDFLPIHQFFTPENPVLSSFCLFDDFIMLNSPNIVIAELYSTRSCCYCFCTVEFVKFFVHIILLVCITLFLVFI